MVGVRVKQLIRHDRKWQEPLVRIQMRCFSLRARLRQIIRFCREYFGKMAPPKMRSTDTNNMDSLRFMFFYRRTHQTNAAINPNNPGMNNQEEKRTKLYSLRLRLNSRKAKALGRMDTRE